MRYTTKKECIARFDKAYSINKQAACNAQDNVEDSMAELNLDYVSAFNVYFDADFVSQLENNQH